MRQRIAELIDKHGIDVGALLCCLAVGAFDWRIGLFAFGAGIFYLSWSNSVNVDHQETE